jgi:4-amino-4-deoxy-L-arabinose transferase-like glycosyltransferase
VVLLIGCLRIHLLQIPLERDEGEYAYAGQLILQGYPPYDLAYNMKLPGTYYAYAAGMAVFGQTATGIHLMLLTANALTIVFIFLLGRALSGPATGLVACASYGLMSSSLVVLGQAAHATQFVVLFAVPGTWLLWRTVQSGRRGELFSSGLLYGLAFLMKQQGMFFGVFGLLVLVSREWSRSPRPLVKESAQRIGLFVLGAGLPLLAICGLLAASGVFSKFWFWTFAYAWQYATNIPIAEGFGNLLAYLRGNFNFYAGFWFLAAVGSIYILWQGAERRRFLFVLGFLLFSFLGTTPGCHFYYHYFILVLPAFALILGLAVRHLSSALTGAMRFIPAAFLIGVMAWDVWLQRVVYFQLPPQASSQFIYGGNPFVEAEVVSGYIRANAAPDARVAVFGSEPEIYFYTRRHSATGYIYTDSLMENQPYAAKMQQEMIREIESAKPEYFVVVINIFSWMQQESSDMDIWRWAQQYTTENYDCVGLVDLRPGTPGFMLWGDEAKKFTARLAQFYGQNQAQYLEVYKRKSKAN